MPPGMDFAKTSELSVQNCSRAAVDGRTGRRFLPSDRSDDARGNSLVRIEPVRRMAVLHVDGGRNDRPLYDKRD